MEKSDKWKKRTKFLIGLLIVTTFFLGYFSGQFVLYKRVLEEMKSSSMFDMNTTNAPASKEWVTIKVFEGTGVKTTEDFSIPVDYWRIKYTVQLERYSTFGFFVYRSGEKALYEESVIQDQSGTEVTYIRATPGKFYLKIIGVYVNWKIEIQVLN